MSVSIVNKAMWWCFALVAIVVGLYPAIYFLVDGDFGLLQTKPETLVTNAVWTVAFYIHIVLGGVALLIGWIQFDKKLRDRHRKLHKRIGMAYVTAVFFSSLAGIYIGLFATGGIVSELGCRLALHLDDGLVHCQKT